MDANTKDSVGKLTAAISGFQQAVVPMVHQLIGVVQKNADQMNATGKQILQVVDQNLDRVSASASQLASSGSELAAALADRTTTGGPTPPKPRA